MQTYFVIFHGPEQQFRPGTRYYDADAAITSVRRYAMKFLSFDDAKQWAEEHVIELSEMDYIGKESFPDIELD